MASSRDASNGPDWTDVAVAMNSIGEFHGAELTLLMSLAGARDAGSMRLTMRATKHGGANGAASASVSRSVWFPNQDSATMAGAALKLTYEMDLDCGAMWLQSEMFA